MLAAGGKSLMRHVATLNVGSSSLKFGLFKAGDGDPIAICTGLVDRIGSEAAQITAQSQNGAEIANETTPRIRDHVTALNAALLLLEQKFPGVRISAVGHRIVHGGPDNDQPISLTLDSLRMLEGLMPFAPLHQPYSLAGAQVAMRRFPQALQVACFDTAFHRHHAWENDSYALPAEYYRAGVRRYGFHGLSYDYISGYLAEKHPKLQKGRVIVAHLGNGASLCAIDAGKSVATTMGFSALDGLAMGTRCGQIDPGVVLYLMEQRGMNAAEISDLLYKKSGLLGLSGLSNDMRVLEQSDTEDARNAIKYFTARARREIASLAAVLEGMDTLVFTGGIGENSALIRKRICQGLEWLGVGIDTEANAQGAAQISTRNSRVQILVVPTNEELMIARAASTLLGQVENSRE